MEVCFGKNETRHRSEGLTKRDGRKGQDMKKWTGMITNLTMLTQFGLSLVTPLFSFVWHFAGGFATAFRLEHGFI